MKYDNIILFYIKQLLCNFITLKEILIVLGYSIDNIIFTIFEILPFKEKTLHLNKLQFVKKKKHFLKTHHFLEKTIYGQVYIYARFTAAKHGLIYFYRNCYLYHIKCHATKR